MGKKLFLYIAYIGINITLVVGVATPWLISSRDNMLVGAGILLVFANMYHLAFHITKPVFKLLSQLNKKNR